MTLDADTRRRLAELRRAVKAIEAPERERKKIQRAKARAKREKALSRSSGQRQPRERDPGFLAFLRRQPCAVRHMGGCAGAVQAAHIRFSDSRQGRGNPGLGTKNHDRFCTALCEAHHIRDQHAGAERAFWERAGLNAYDVAARLYEQYRSTK